MEKKYIQPRVEVTSISVLQMIAESKPQAGVNPNNPGAKPGDFESKERDEDYESTTWSDGGLW